MQISECISWIANSCLVIAIVFQGRGKLYLAFPLGLLSSILFFYYGYILMDKSFILMNGLIFVPLNFYGSVKWILKHKRKETVEA